MNSTGVSSPSTTAGVTYSNLQAFLLPRRKLENANTFNHVRFRGTSTGQNTHPNKV